MSKSIIKQKRILTKAGGGSSISIPVSVANGGTGLSSYTVGDLIYASGATTLSKLADVATGSVLVSGGVGVAPSWSTTLTLGVASATDGAIVLRSASNAFTTTIKTGVTGASYTLTLPTDDGSANQILQTNGAGVLSWATPSSGITVGTTTITSGTSTRVAFNDGGVYAEDADFTWNKTTNILNTTSGYSIGGAFFFKASSGPGTGGLFLGGMTNTTGNRNIFLTVNGASTTTSEGCVLIGDYMNFLSGMDGKNNTIAIGNGMTGLGASNALVLGSSSSAGWASDVGNNEAWFGTNGTGVSGTPGYQQFYFGQGKTKVSPLATTLNATGGSGTNNAGANLTLAAGKSTGSATPAVINFQSTAAGASSSTAQTLATVLQITNSTTITTSDAVNYALGSTTGTKFGTATTQKLAFWNATPIVQPSGATQAAPAAYATGAFGLDSDANMQALYDLVVAMRTALVNVGIMKGSA